MTTEQFIEKAKAHLIKWNSYYIFDIVSAGVCPWEDAPHGSVISITTKLRGRANNYEVWEYARKLEDMGEDEFVFARVASTGEHDSVNYDGGKW